MSIDKISVSLAKAALDGSIGDIRTLVVRLIRDLKKVNVELADDLAKALAEHSNGASTMRATGMGSLPRDRETLNELASTEYIGEMQEPMFDEAVTNKLHSFINERQSTEKLLRAGLTPPSSLLLHGPPGVGKTELAKYLSNLFELPLITLDLSSVISSYLGKTGQNLKKVLDYAKANPSILLLDEFDAVAKRRDDNSDLGELKRIVNVLLKELENWPYETLLIAATNHSKLLDPAIWRRFDRDIFIDLPKYEQRFQMFSRNEYLETNHDTQKLVAKYTEGLSGSDINKLIERTLRTSVLNDTEPNKEIIFELLKYKGLEDVSFNKEFAAIAKNELKMSLMQIAEELGKSKSTIQYYLKGDKKK